VTVRDSNSVAPSEIGFIYESQGGAHWIEWLLKCGILFFDGLAIKVSDDADRRAGIWDYLIAPMQDQHLLQVISSAEIMTEDALDKQNEIILDLLNAGAFDYLGTDPYWENFVKIHPGPLCFEYRALERHRAFLTPVAEELIRRRLAVPLGKEVPAGIRRMLDAEGGRPWDGSYSGPSGQKLPTRTTSRGTAFPYFTEYRSMGDPIEFDGKPFLQLAVHRDVAFLHEEIVRMIAYSAAPGQIQYHPFTNGRDRPRAEKFLHLLPGSAYAEIVMTDLEQIAIDLRDVPLDDLLDFRREHQSRFVEYRIGLSSAIRELSLCSDKEERDSILLRRQEEFAVLARDLKRACRLAFGVRLGASAVGAVGMAWALGHGDPVEAMLAAGSAILGVVGAAEPFSHIRYLHDIQGEFYGSYEYG
jgi:hypothetical protein